mmetsp:Transcript_33016/g.76068  ORF Transcript_33016/g.76068 Transcript_33016/m.76068 type:complete len:283 (-) Transcript_33016:1974-2822(-)
MKDHSGRRLPDTSAGGGDDGLFFLDRFRVDNDGRNSTSWGNPPPAPIPPSPPRRKPSFNVSTGDPAGYCRPFGFSGHADPMPPPPPRHPAESIDINHPGSPSHVPSHIHSGFDEPPPSRDPLPFRFNIPSGWPPPLPRPAYSDVPTSLVSFRSSQHGRKRRKQRDISIDSLQRAIKRGRRFPCGAGRSRYIYDSVVYVVEDATGREVSSWKIAKPLLPVKISEKEQKDNEEALELVKTCPERWNSHSVLIVDCSGSMFCLLSLNLIKQTNTKYMHANHIVQI